MNPEKSKNCKIVEKLTHLSSQTKSPQIGNKVKIETRDGEGSNCKVISGLYTLGAHQLNPLIEEVIIQMKVGDEWKIDVQNLIYGNQVIYLKLISIQQVNADICQNIVTKAQNYKKEGNQFFKDKKLSEAINCYKSAYDLVEYVCNKEGTQLRLALIGNLALSTLNSLRFSECLQWCHTYLTETFEPNKKIYYREVMALKGQKQWQKSKNKINTALQIFKKDLQATADFKTVKEAIQKQQKTQTAKQKNLYGKMLG